MGSIIDLSHPLDPQTPVYPGDPPVELRTLESTDQRRSDGSPGLNVGGIAMGLHAATHLDVPFHFFGEGLTVEQVPLERCMGPAILIPLPGHGPGAPITPADLARYRTGLAETGKGVLNTGWHRHWGQPDYFSAHPVLTPEAACSLVEWGVHLVGVDFPSVDLAPYPAHLALLGSGVLILENLTNLEALAVERFLLIALPLPIVGREASPVRAVGVRLCGPT